MSVSKRAVVVGVAVALLSPRAFAHTEDSSEPPPPQTQSDRHREPAKEEEGEHRAVRIGALGGLGFPRPLEIEGMLEIGDYVGLGVEYGVMPKTSIASIDTKMWATAADLRIFPFRGIFFVGLRAGYQHIDASTTLAAAAVSVTESAELDTTFLNPRLGVLWTMRSGITLGIDAGIQIPMSSSFSSTLPPVVTSSTPATSLVDTLGGVLPTFDLLQIGFLF